MVNHKSATKSATDLAKYNPEGTESGELARAYLELRVLACNFNSDSFKKRGATMSCGHGWPCGCSHNALIAALK